LFDHGFGYNSVNRKSSYQTPLSGSYSYIYDKDRRLIQTNFPSGKSIFNDYADPGDPDDKSRLWQIRTPEGNIDFTYLCGTKVESLTAGTESINYDYDATLNLRAEVVAASRWDKADYENGEQELPGYAVLNLKGSKTFADHFELTLGVDNLLDKTYAISNTYKDLILLATPGNEVMLLNEPGRYLYANLRYTF